MQFLDDALDGLLDAAGQGHRVMAGGDGLEALAVDGLGQDGGGGGAVAGHVAGLAGGFLDELGAHVLVGVLQLDFLGHGDAVLGDVGAAPALVEDGIAAARPQGAAHGPGQLADAGQQFLAGLVAVSQLLCSHPRLLSIFPLWESYSTFRESSRCCATHTIARIVPWQLVSAIPLFAKD